MVKTCQDSRPKKLGNGNVSFLVYLDHLGSVTTPLPTPTGAGTTKSDIPHLETRRVPPPDCGLKKRLKSFIRIIQSRDIEYTVHTCACDTSICLYTNS